MKSPLHVNINTIFSTKKNFPQNSDFVKRVTLVFILANLFNGWLNGRVRFSYLLLHSVCCATTSPGLWKTRERIRPKHYLSLKRVLTPCISWKGLKDSGDHGIGAFLVSAQIAASLTAPSPQITLSSSCGSLFSMHIWSSNFERNSHTAVQFWQETTVGDFPSKFHDGT